MDATPVVPEQERPIIQHVKLTSPFKWLGQAWLALRKAPLHVFFYGLVFVVMGYVFSYYFSTAPETVITLSTLFLLVGPFLAIGLYDLAKQLDDPGKGAAQRPSLWHSMIAWRTNIQGFSLYAVLLAVLVFAWFRTSLLIFALFYDASGLTSLEHVLTHALLPVNRMFLFTYFGSGFVFALLVFASSAIALPMLLDKDIDTITAVLTSLQVVMQNGLPMLLWAGLIVGLCVLGFLTFYIGLAFTVPLVGLATWYAYRDLISYET